jgi:hypothetical protein
VSVVRGEARRRWLTVLGAVAALCALPVVLGAVPVPGSSLSAPELRDRILASADEPYQGYAESRGSLGLPDLPGLGDVSALLGSTSRIRAWYAARDRWRVDLVEATGERGLYRSPRGMTVWDYERNGLTEIIGDPPVRLPRVSDLLPPDLARRVLAGAGSADRLQTIGARRVAGRTAAGLRLVPGDPETLVGRVDVWADEDTGLPLEVQVTGRQGDAAVLGTRFLDLRLSPPDAATVTPVQPPGASFASTGAPDLATAMSRYAPFPLPGALAGRSRTPVPGGFEGVGGYGGGLSMFVVLPLPGRLGFRALGSARDAGAEEVQIPSARARVVRTSVLTALVVRSEEDGRSYLLAGMVTPDLLRTAAAELISSGELR